MNIQELSEKESENLKNKLADDGLIFEINTINKYDEKFFDIVTLTNSVTKLLLFFSVGLYVLFILSAVVLSVLYKTFNIVRILASIIVCVVVMVISFGIFRNINTDKKAEKRALYIVNGNFVFNFNNGVTDTKKLFLSRF